MQFFDDDYFMQQALLEAGKAKEEGEIPIGCVVVCKNQIIGRGHNQIQQLHDATAHAELIAISASINNLGSKYLPQCSLFVTLEPCIMCAGAIGLTHIKRLIYGCKDSKKGFSLFSPTPLHPKTSITTGILKNECENILKNFFKSLRL